MRGKKILVGIFALTFIISLVSIAYGQPVGGQLTEGDSSRRDTQAAKTHNAVAGNVTALDINAVQITNVWQGYYGNISGGITLDNANNDTFYNWTLATPTGEVYATRTSVSDWTTVECANQTAIYQEEATLNIENASSEGINDTFLDGTHPSFTVGASSALTTCRNALPYDNAGNERFWNVLLNVDQTTRVFTSIINATQNAFDGGDTVDFEMLVPTDTQTTSTTYYFYIELA